jgi:hypothetical protein
MKRACNYILIDHTPVALDCSTEKGLKAWVHWMEHNRSQCMVAVDEIGPFWVSTVFMGLDQKLSKGPPQLFETMILEQEESTCLLVDGNIELIDNAKSELHQLRWRYSSWEEAEQGHRAVAGMVSRSLHKDSRWWESVARIVNSKPVVR